MQSELIKSVSDTEARAADLDLVGDDHKDISQYIAYVLLNTYTFTNHTITLCSDASLGLWRFLISSSFLGKSD